MCLFWAAITGYTGEVSGYCKQVSCIPAAMPGADLRIQRRQAHSSLVGGGGKGNEFQLPIDALLIELISQSLTAGSTSVPLVRWPCRKYVVRQIYASHVTRA